MIHKEQTFINFVLYEWFNLERKKNYKQREKIFLCLLFCFCLNFNTIFFKLVFKENFKWLDLIRIYLSFSKIKNYGFFFCCCN